MAAYERAMLRCAVAITGEGLGEGVGERWVRICWMEVRGVVDLRGWAAFAEEFYEGLAVLR